MSGDANYIGYGFANTWVLRYSSGTYSLYMNFPLSGRIAFSCAIGGANEKYVMAVGYADYAYSQNMVAKWSLNSTKAPSNPDWVRSIFVCTKIWQEWVGTKSAGPLQDGLFRAEITSSGQYFAFAGWGNREKTSPQVLVFSSSKVNWLKITAHHTRVHQFTA